MTGYLSGRKYQRTSIVVAQMDKKIVAPLQYEGTMDHVLFEAWFEQCLIPSLPENSVIVMDNASFHCKAVLKLLAEKHGQILVFLPPYSPKLNPIENFWAWLKRKLRKILTPSISFNSAIKLAFNLV